MPVTELTCSFPWSLKSLSLHAAERDLRERDRAPAPGRAAIRDVPGTEDNWPVTFKLGRSKGKEGNYITFVQIELAPVYCGI